MTLLHDRIDAKFQLGEIIVSEMAGLVLSSDDIYVALSRHQRGDWGDVTWMAAKKNEQSLTEGGRLLSRYSSGDDVDIAIVVLTVADRSWTKILLKEEF